MHRSSAVGIVTATIALSLGLGLPAAEAGGPSGPDPLSPDPLSTVRQTVASLTAPQTDRRAAPASAGSAMTGRFVISSGSCTSTAVPRGSYFSMRDPSGGAVNNGNSPCSNQAATPLRAGTEGLTPGRMQPFNPSPGSSDAIVAPANFFSSPFAVATQSPDKQSGTNAGALWIVNNGGRLSGEIRCFQAYYNGAYYNQGAPKPDGSTPGSTTSGLTGTYDSSSGAFTLDWKSTISGGAFNNFTGVWHLEGVYRAASAATSGGSGQTAGGAGTSSSSSSAQTAQGGGTAGAQGLANTGLATGPPTVALLLLAGLAAITRRASRGSR